MYLSVKENSMGCVLGQPDERGKSHILPEQKQEADTETQVIQAWEKLHSLKLRVTREVN